MDNVFLYVENETVEANWHDGAQNCLKYACLCFVIFSVIACFIVYLLGDIFLSSFSVKLLTQPNISDWSFVLLPPLLCLGVVFLRFNFFNGFWGWYKYKQVKSRLARMKLVVHESACKFEWTDGETDITFFCEDIKSWKSYYIFPDYYKLLQNPDKQSELAYCKKDVFKLHNGQEITLNYVFNPDVHDYLVSHQLALRLPEPQFKEIKLLYIIRFRNRIGRSYFDPHDIETTLV